jgi:hypothetical protein
LLHIAQLFSVSVISILSQIFRAPHHIAGGDKGSQKQDIKQAKALWSKVKKAGVV